MASEVDICNMAIAETGGSQFISSISPSDGSKAASICALYYAISRDQALKEIAPGFARVRRTLNQLEGTVSNWAYAYQYPTDCLRVLQMVIPGLRHPRVEDRTPYEVANLAGSKVILADIKPAEALYVQRVEDTELFDSQFTSALVNLLAARIAVPMTSDGPLANALMTSYYALRADTWAHDRNESVPDLPQPSIFESFRA